MDKTSDEKLIDQIISRYRGKPGETLGILEEIQSLNPHKYLPKETLEYIAKKNPKVPLSRLYSIVKFYAFFNLQPQGEHTIIVCRGTACHTRGSKNLLESIKSVLKIKETDSQEEESFTTSDNKFTIKSVACFGQCALSPVVAVDGNIYGHITEQKIKKIMRPLKKSSDCHPERSEGS
ncbi:MAG: NAD(P)H-dependent oxidoreductase subunit E, partial [Elusimicrobiota bacterium]|nr:NAD(P)H-dependent oxidoreductase subunit E [Elusimicrobiota bacterium]